METGDTTTFDESYKFSTVAGKDDDTDTDYIRFRRTGDNHKDKFMMVDFKDGDKKLKIKSYTSIDDLCTNNSLDFILSKGSN